ncbi:MAG: transcriptional repressor [Bacteroidota bacterium]
MPDFAQSTMDANIVELLRKSHLNITMSRMQILLLFYNNYNKQNCLSHEDILKGLGNQANRITVYRTLRAFVKKGLLYCVPTATNCIMYGLQIPDIKHSEPTQYAHFTCDRCRKVYPLKTVNMSWAGLPADFIIRQFDIVMNGRCNNCK